MYRCCRPSRLATFNLASVVGLGDKMTMRNTGIAHVHFATFGINFGLLEPLGPSELRGDLSQLSI